MRNSKLFFAKLNYITFCNLKIRPFIAVVISIISSHVVCAQPIRPPTGYAVVVGVETTTATSSQHTNFDANATKAAPADAETIKFLLLQRGFDPKNVSLLNTNKTSRADTILKAIKQLQSKTIAGDLVVFYFSGHGDQRRERLNDPNRDEADSLDELLIASDRPIIDDELYTMWLTFGPSVRLLMITDACHSGTMFAITDFPVRRLPNGFDPFAKLDPGTRITKEELDNMSPAEKNVAKKKANESLRFDKERLFAETTSTAFDCMLSGQAPDEKFQMIYLGACYDRETTLGGAVRSLFTGKLFNALNDPSDEFRGYQQWMLRSRSCLAVINYAELGPVTDKFRNSLPFQINVP